MLNFAGFVAVGFEHALSRNMSENQAPETAPKFDEGRGALVCATGEELGKMKVKVKGWHAVANWHWNVQGEETCGICRNPYEMHCPDCKRPGDDCPPTWGVCKHAFHLHCIMKWIQGQDTQGGSRNQCPICRQEWDFQHDQ